MSFVKISSDLFLESQELKRFQKFLSEDGYRKHIAQNTLRFGIIHNKNLDPDFNNARVTVGSNANAISINSILGLNQDGNFIFRNQIDNLSLPTSDGTWYWVRASHFFDTFEQGTISIAADGTMTGTGTAFTEVLRGQQNYQSVIRFESTNNTQDYSVTDVTNDTTAILNGNFTPETDIRYSVVGTFTAGTAKSPNDQLIFQYDSSFLEFVQETSTETPPTLTENFSFFLARVSVQGGQVVVEDKRGDYLWRTKADFDFWKLVQGSPLVGVERIRFDDTFSSQENNLVRIAWGFRSTNWSIESSLNRLTLSGGQGGVFDDIDAVDDGDFNGWRVYLSEGQAYSTIKSTTIAGNQVNLDLDHLDPLDYRNTNQQVIVVPDVESIDIWCTDQAQRRFIGDTARINKNFHFPINIGYADLPLLAFDDPTSMYNIKYRYKNNFTYGAWSVLRDGDYLTEASFNADGSLKPIGERVTKSYTADPENGYIELTLNPSSYIRTIQRSLLGSEIFDISTAVNRNAGANNFLVGTNRKNIHITGSRTFTDDVVLNISLENTQAGNEFIFYLETSTIDLNGNSLTINFDFQTPNVNEGRIIYRFTETDFDYVNWERGVGLSENNRVVIRCVYDGDNDVWKSVIQEKDEAILGQVRMLNSVDGFTGADGLGNTDETIRWALCNGNNGTLDLREKFVVGYSGTGDYENVGDELGSNETELTINNLPEHNHLVGTAAEGEGSSGVEDTVRNFGSTGQVATYTTSGIQGRTAPPDEVTPVDNRPASVVIAYIQRVRKN